MDIQNSKPINSSRDHRYLSDSDSDIDFKSLWLLLWKRKLFISCASLSFAVLAALYSLQLPNIYKAETLLAPTQNEKAGGLSSLAGQLGGIASLAGINVGGSSTDKTTIAIETLKSRVFIESFVHRRNILVPLMAGTGWNSETGDLILSNDIFSTETNKWIGKTAISSLNRPTTWESFVAFKKLISIQKDNDSGLIRLSLSFFAPEVAKKWLGWLVDDINSVTRQKDKQQAQLSIEFLEKQLSQTTVTSMQTVFHKLVEEQTKNMMLINSSPEYVFMTIDPPQVPDKKDAPKRALITIFGLVLGFVLSVSIVLFTRIKDNESKPAAK